MQVSSESSRGNGGFDDRVIARPVEFAPLGDSSPAGAAANNMSILLDISLPLVVELGRGKVTVKDALALAPGSIVELDKRAGDPVDILLNDKLIAHGEVVVVGDNFGVRICDIVSVAVRAQSLG
jgi:flagellar motor switch protein FliN/FliY